MTHKLTCLAVASLLLPLSTAYAYIYTVGPNKVNMPGSACRSPTAGTDSNLTHDLGATTVKSHVALQTVFCPVARRGTSFYGGRRLDGTTPSKSAQSELKAKIVSAIVRAQDASSQYDLSCAIFGTRMSDQAIFFGAPKSLCIAQQGCDSVSSGWTGTNTMALSPPSNFDNVLTVNFGIMCNIPAGSSVFYTETSVTPN